MKITFLGTRGNIEPRTDLHYMHSAMLVEYYHHRIMIDCGEDWSGRIPNPAPHAIFVTHSHPDHAWGLKEGAPCPVYATKETWEEMRNYDIKDQKVIETRKPEHLLEMAVEAFPVDHSTRAPAVGYRITAGEVTIFYIPDVVYIHDRAKALQGAKLYIGDGATITRSMVRKPEDTLIGHTPIRTQLTWCQKEGVPRAVFTHLGSQIVAGDQDEVTGKIEELAEERDVNVEIAHDGMELVLR